MAVCLKDDKKHSPPDNSLQLTRLSWRKLEGVCLPKADCTYFL